MSGNRNWSLLKPQPPGRRATFGISAPNRKGLNYMNHLHPSIPSGPRPGRNISVHPAPHWPGEGRPHGARRVRQQNRWPSPGYLTYLVRELGYDGNAAFAAIIQAHKPWRHSVDRRRARPVDADPERGTVPRAYSRIVSVVHPYVPAAPSRRLRTGGV